MRINTVSFCCIHEYTPRHLQNETKIKFTSFHFSHKDAFIFLKQRVVMHSDVPFLPLENTYVTSMLSQPTEGIIIFNKTVIKRQFNLHVKGSVMRAIIKSNHDYRYQSKQPWKQLTFYCLDNIIRLPNCEGKHGM